jgi:hypothetical protein
MLHKASQFNKRVGRKINISETKEESFASGKVNESFKVARVVWESKRKNHLSLSLYVVCVGI